MLLAACTATTRAPSVPASANSVRADLTGTWVLTTQSKVGAQDSEMIVRHAGSAIDGTLTSHMGRVAYKGTVEGDAVAFDFTINAQGVALPILYRGKIVGDTMSGKAIFGSFGEGTFTAQRKK